MFMFGISLVTHSQFIFAILTQYGKPTRFYTLFSLCNEFLFFFLTDPLLLQKCQYVVEVNQKIIHV